MNYLRLYRLKNNLTMQDLAETTGISLAKYRSIETGEQTASDDVVNKIVDTLKVSKETLFHPVKYTIREIEDEIFN